jgi:hypothetical protein
MPAASSSLYSKILFITIISTTRDKTTFAIVCRAQYMKIFREIVLLFGRKTINE